MSKCKVGVRRSRLEIMPISEGKHQTLLGLVEIPRVYFHIALHFYDSPQDKYCKQCGDMEIETQRGEAPCPQSFFW